MIVCAAREWVGLDRGGLRIPTLGAAHHCSAGNTRFSQVSPLPAQEHRELGAGHQHPPCDTASAGQHWAEPKSSRSLVRCKRLVKN